MRNVNAKVAHVLSESTLALNAGQNKGIRVGDTVRLWRSIDIKDPDTGEDLGGVRMAKVSLRVNHVQDKLCTAAVTDLVEASGGVNSLFNVTQVRAHKTLTTGAPSKGQVTVKVGDAATIEGPDEDEEDVPF